MNEQEALKSGKALYDNITSNSNNIIPTKDYIKYVAKANEALEKQIPYKPKVYEDKYYGCKCGNVLLHKWKKYNTELMPKIEGLPYCLNYGQKLDWSDEE